MNKGDRVEIITKEFEGNGVGDGKHFGLQGTITEIHNTSPKMYYVMRSDGVGIWYYQHHLNLLGCALLVPDFSLEELEAAEKILSELQA